MTRLLTRRTGIIALVAAIVVVTGGVWWWRAHREGLHLSAVFGESVGVYPGSDVRILGVPVGAVDSVTPRGTDVLVAMHLDPDVHVTAGTWAVIVSPALVGDRYVQLTGAYVSGAKLRDGARIPLTRTRTPVELDTIYRNLISLTQAFGPNGANADGSLNRLLRVAAANLSGNGTAFNTTLQRLSAASATFAGSKDDIVATLDQLSQFTSMLQQNDSGVATVNQQLAAVTQTLADDRATFAAALKELSSALVLVQRFIHDNTAALTSNVGKLATVAKILASQRDSLTQAINAAPLLVQNFLNAYDPKRNVLRGRADLNELGVWDTATTNGPPNLLPSAGGS